MFLDHVVDGLRRHIAVGVVAAFRPNLTGQIPIFVQSTEDTAVTHPRICSHLSSATLAQGGMPTERTWPRLPARACPEQRRGAVMTQRPSRC